MRQQLLRPTTVLGAIIVVEAAALIGVVGIQRWRATGVSAAERGRQVAERLGCFACHGPGGTQGIANPGSDETEVPAWSGGTVMMYVQNERQIREWILYGEPRGHEHEEHEHGEEGHESEAAEHADHGDHESAGEPHPTDPSDRTDPSDAAHQRPLLDMPAYEGRLTEQELGDLIAYYKAVAWFPMPTDEKARAGMEVAHKQGCFGCHGPAGRGTVSNPGSFKGYIPGWDGSDFGELVGNEQELREWVLDGISQRFAKNPAAKAFLDRAPLKMPAYKAVLTPKDLEALADYLRWLRREPERTRP